MVITKETVKEIINRAFEAKQNEMHWFDIYSESNEKDEFAYNASNDYMNQAKAYLTCYELLTGHYVYNTLISIREELDLIS